MKVCVSCSSTTGATRMAPTTSHQANACSAVPTGNLIRLYRAPSQSQQLRMFPLPYQPDRLLVLSIQRLNGEQRCSFATRVQHPAKARLRGASILTQFNTATTRHTLWCDPTAPQNSRIKRHRRDIQRFFRPDDFPEQKIIIFKTTPEVPVNADARGPAATHRPTASTRPTRQRRGPDRYGVSIDSGQMTILERRVPYNRHIVHSAEYS